MKQIFNEGTPCTVKVVRTVWSGGKVEDNFKSLPIAIQYRYNTVKCRYRMYKTIKEGWRAHGYPVKGPSHHWRE